MEGLSKKEDHSISIQEAMTRYGDVVKQLETTEKEEIKVIVAESEGEEESTKKKAMKKKAMKRKVMKKKVMKRKAMKKKVQKEKARKKVRKKDSEESSVGS